MSDLVKRLRATKNWQRQEDGHWKDAVSVYDKAPFEAADEIERLQKDAARWRMANRLRLVTAEHIDRAIREAGDSGADAVDAAIDAAMKERPR